MYLDKFSNPIFEDSDIFKMMYQGKMTALSKLTVSNTPEIKTFQEISEITFQDFAPCIEFNSISEFDASMQHHWFMPDEYKTMDIKSWLIEKCNTNEEKQRVTDELLEYESRDMLDILRWLTYFVDTCRTENVLWGVGRGSSVASYVLYLIGIHRINSIKYNLNWKEFLR